MSLLSLSVSSRVFAVACHQTKPRYNSLQQDAHDYNRLQQAVIYVTCEDESVSILSVSVSRSQPLLSSLSPPPSHALSRSLPLSLLVSLSVSLSVSLPVSLPVSLSVFFSVSLSVSLGLSFVLSRAFSRPLSLVLFPFLSLIF